MARFFVCDVCRHATLPAQYEDWFRATHQRCLVDAYLAGQNVEGYLSIREGRGSLSNIRESDVLPFGYTLHGASLTERLAAEAFRAPPIRLWKELPLPADWAPDDDPGIQGASRELFPETLPPRRKRNA